MCWLYILSSCGRWSRRGDHQTQNKYHRNLLSAHFALVVHISQLFLGMSECLCSLNYKTVTYFYQKSLILLQHNFQALTLEARARCRRKYGDA